MTRRAYFAAAWSSGMILGLGPRGPVQFAEQSFGAQVKESMQARGQPTFQTTSTAGGRDTLPEWSKGVDSSSTSVSCVGSNPTGVIVTQGPCSNGGAICCRSCDTAWLSKANPQIIHPQARGRD